MPQLSITLKSIQRSYTDPSPMWQWSKRNFYSEVAQPASEYHILQRPADVRKYPSEIMSNRNGRSLYQSSIRRYKLDWIPQKEEHATSDRPSTSTPKKLRTSLRTNTNQSNLITLIVTLYPIIEINITPPPTRGLHVQTTNLMIYHSEIFC